MGYTEVTAPGLADYPRAALMGLLGVEVARKRQVRHYEQNRNKTTWVTTRSLSTAERTMLDEETALVRRAIGPFALDRVRVYSESDEAPCMHGFYTPGSGDTAIHRGVLADRYLTRTVLVHEAAHRVGHRGGGRWPSIPDWRDRTRGFEFMLSEFSALLLGYLADGTPLPDAATLPDPATPQGSRRLWRADDPAVPVTRRELAHLLAEQVPHALAAGGFTSVKDMVSSTAVHPDYWRTLTNPRRAGHRQQRGGRAWDYDKVALLAEAARLHPPVVWLGYHLCEGSIHGRTRETWGRPGRWAKKMREAMLLACADLQALGGAYAAQVPALQDLLEGRTPAPLDDDTWTAPARRLIAVERDRLGLSDAPRHGDVPSPADDE